jgi:Sulfotransferase family
VSSSRSADPIDPIFIVGVGRSGTTLLVNLMGAHPLLAPIYETPFLRKIMRHCERVSRLWRSPLYGAFPSLCRRILARECSTLRSQLEASLDGADPTTIKQKYESFPFGLARCILYTRADMARESELWTGKLLAGPLSDEELYQSVRQFIDRLFAIHCARLEKHFWINKTNALLVYLDRLARVYPSARCIHILRDGRDVVCSVTSLPWGAKTVGEAARHWKGHILKGRTLAKAASLKYIEIRYEDLLTSPSQILSQLFSFLEMDADIDHITRSLPVDTTRFGGWREALNQRDKEIFSRTAGDLLIDLGYEKDDRWVR